MPDQNQTLVDMLMQTWPARLAQSAVNGVMAPGRAWASDVPITTDQMIQPAMDMAGLATFGTGAFPATANELRAGIRTYQSVPDSLMGFRKNGPQKGYSETNYPHSQNVEITLPPTPYASRETFSDQIMGMNPNHAYERAWRNWPDALHITPVSPNDAMIAALLKGGGT